ncbi:helix-turn-helix transcriptional regulator [Saccharopolyspora sp. TS4A08]|uniref:Helix-turn-helix transcriptional regulator n=1 Tax=Saccharopolyspora ipomoeae TaxID=3042027 RepID=A0ABT6PHK6_9PSEU|nr:helix-turn-helix transcriptional regulator [Saccharopolyspora sp. TS4A08]MDI2026981.1 helix-turn-helix transcriptional regulator [Saccharopolyspora sp. TS4A08]
MTSSFEQRRQEFGERLRRSRDEAGLTGRELASALGWAHSKVSKIENGKQTAEDSDVRQWLDAVGAPESDVEDVLAELSDLRVTRAAWRAQLRAGHRARQQQSLDLEHATTRLRNAEFGVVPGLLQTADYARSVFRTQAELLQVPDTDLDSSVRTRMQRQQVLYQGKDIEIIVSQHALRHPVASPEVMLGQLDRLVSALDIPGLRFGVLPEFAQLPNITMNGFTMLDDVVQVEHVSAELTIDDPDQVAIYHRLMDRLWQVAAEGDEARTILRGLAAEHRDRAAS